MHHHNNFPIAIVEAKDMTKNVAHGIQQAIDYARLLDVPFAYSSNGEGFVEYDMLTGKERNLPLKNFPKPEELWNRYCNVKMITEKIETIIKEPFFKSFTACIVQRRLRKYCLSGDDDPDNDDDTDDGKSEEEEIYKKHRINDVPTMIISESEAIYGEDGKLIANHSANLKYLIQEKYKTEQDFISDWLYGDKQSIISSFEERGVDFNRIMENDVDFFDIIFIAVR